MKRITIEVKFNTSFDFEYEDDVEITDELMDQEVDDLIETLSDRTNRYWNDADYIVHFPDKDIIQSVADIPHTGIDTV